MVRWACRAGTRDFCSALAALVLHIFASLYTISITLSPSPMQKAGQPVVHGRLSLSMRLWLPHCLRVGNVLTNRGVLLLQHMTKTILKSLLPSHGITASKNQFHNVNVLEFLNSLWGLGTK